jgi:serine/threonine-protein kinase
MTFPNRSSEAPFKPGDVIAGKYRIERVLGAGGMGVVVAAEHLQLHQRVAIKVLLPEAGTEPDVVARFAREAQAAARIQSEHVARVIDVASLDDGSPFMVMEFLDGQDLGQILARRGPLPLDEAVGYLLQACEGVAEAHAAGVIHRDIKPSNLFVCQKGSGRSVVKVLDFGISKAHQGPGGAADLSLTKTGTVMGSPLYMSPEQMASAKYVDARTDVWSLGVTLFELVSGRTPFRGESMTELIASVLQGEPLSVRDVRPDLPQSIVPAITKALEKDRNRRYANVAELAAAIAPFGPWQAAMSVERISNVLSMPPPAVGASGASHAASPTAVSGGALDATAQAASSPGRATGSTTGQPVSSDPMKKARVVGPSRSKVIAAVAGLLVLAAAGGGALVLKSRRAPAEALVRPEPSAGSAPALVTVPAVETTPAVTLVAPPPPAPQPAMAAPSSAPAVGGAPVHKAASLHPAAVAATPAPAKAPATAAVAAPAAAAPTCRVVQYVDSDGETRFRRECQ